MPEEIDSTSEPSTISGLTSQVSAAVPATITPQIRERLGLYILPSIRPYAPALPNVFTEGKGPNGSLAVTIRQACYDGALGARGMHKLRTFGVDGNMETMYDGNAYTITSTYQMGQLRLYSTHLAQPKHAEGRPGYYMTTVKLLALNQLLRSISTGCQCVQECQRLGKRTKGC